MDWGLSKKEEPLVERLIAEFSANELLLAALVATTETRKAEKVSAHADVLVKQLAMETSAAHEASLALLEQSPAITIATHATVDGKLLMLESPVTYQLVEIEAMSLRERRDLAMAYCTSRVSQLKAGFKGSKSGSAPTIVR